jgi:radical SAM protein with 4Fe4S-binding SPASM domain
MKSISTIMHCFAILKYISAKKMWNYVKLSLSYLCSLCGKVTKFRVMPSFVSIEPVDYCNLRCPQCPVGMGIDKKQRGNQMSLDLFTHIVNEISETLFHIIFYFQGEPTLASSLPDMIQYAHSRNIFTSTSTNAQVLTDELAHELVQSGLDKLIISIDGATQEAYEAYRIGGKLEKAIAGVENIVKWKKTLNKATPFVEIQCLLLKSNENQIEEMKALAKRLGADRLVFKTAQFYNFENGNPLMPENEKHCRYRKDKTTGKYSIKNALHNRCWRLWTGAVIDAKGDILPCCYSKNGKFCFGNMEGNSFENTWNSEPVRRFRQKILNNRQQFEMCRNCTE